MYPIRHWHVISPVRLFKHVPPLHGFGEHTFDTTIPLVLHEPGFFVSVSLTLKLQKVELQQVVQIGVVA
jgi:hypothetical protein